MYSCIYSSLVAAFIGAKLMRLEIKRFFKERTSLIKDSHAHGTHGTKILSDLFFF